jgi:hypothetical protein
MKARTIFAVVALSAVTMFPTVSNRAANAAGAKSPADLVTKYREAHDSHNLQAMKAICWWSGVNNDDKSMIQGAELGRFAMPLKSVEFRPDTNNNKPFTIPIRGKATPLNLPLAGYLDVALIGQQGNMSNFKQTYWVGKKNGKLYIAFLSEPPVKKKK